VAQVVILDDLSGLTLLAEAITGSDGTEFARFMKILNASEWVRRGHDAYVHKADGKCPFCQQKLPDDFETSMASAFDESCQESLNTLRTLQSNYDTKMKAPVALYQGNLDNVYPMAEELAVYGTKLAELQSRILENNQLIADKESIDCDQYRDVFHTIFVVMDREQHYKRMMEEVG
jgi:wobble nucleotide-excising tRNase